jgi:uncharacterized protein YgiM (DUF1202 family)
VTLPQVNDVDGVQGVLSPARFGRGEISQSAYVNVVTDFGAPRAVARFDSGVEVALDSAPTSGPVQLPTATPDGVTITIVNNIQNVRGGPSINYPILGQLQKDDQARVIGATADNEWVVIDFRGQQGWLATYLLEVFGDLNSVPIITPPPTPTPLPATATPTPAPFPDLVVIAPPSGNFTIGQAFVIQVTVRNQGSVDAGPFAVAITLPSENLYMAQNLPGLAAGQQTITTLSGTLSSVTGTYTSIFIADLNSQVNEGPAGEANNNTFAFTYFVDRPLLSSGSITISSGGTVDLDSGGTIDLLWTGSSLDRQNAATIAIIGGLTYPNSHYDALQPSVITQLTLTSGLIPVGSAVAFVTSEGKRGILRVDAITNGGPLTITYRVYN